MAITQNNVQNVKFLRNGSVFTPSADKTARQVALDTMEAQKNNLADGTAILGRYNEGADGSTVKTLVGFAYISDETKTLTVFDVDGAGADVEKKINELRNEINAKLGDGITSANSATVQLAALSGNNSSTSAETSVEGAKRYADELKNQMEYTGVTTGTGVYVTNVTQADGIVSATTATLPSVNAISENGKPITAVSESLGTISATAGTINAEFVNIADSGSLISATTVEGALAEIAAEIDAMDKTADVVAGQVVITVSETDGKVSETKANVKDLQLGGYSKDSSATGDIASTDTVNAALSKLENKAAAITIASADKTVKVETASTGTDISVNIDGTTLIKNASTGVISSNLKIVSIEQGSGSTYASQYQLVYGDSNQPIGDIISVGKDQFLKEADYNPETQKLVLTMWNSTGGTTDIEVDFSEAVIEAEAGKGLYVNMDDHSLNVGVASSSETVTISDGQGSSKQVNVLIVNDDSIEVQNIQNAIDYKASTLNATVSGETSDGKVNVKVIETAGKITNVEVVGTDIASEAKLNGLSAKTVTSAAMTGGTATIADNSTDGTKKIEINVDGSSISATSYSKGTDASAIVATDTINQALGKLENQIEAAKGSATTEVAEGTDAGNNMSIAHTTGESGQNIYTINLTDVASASALTAEIAARKAVDGQNGDTYAANSGKKYISGATSLNDADIALNDALGELDADVIKSVKVNDVALAEASNSVNVQISAAAGTGAQTAAIKVNTDNSTGAVTISLLGLDCGTY